MRPYVDDLIGELDGLYRKLIDLFEGVKLADRVEGEVEESDQRSIEVVLDPTTEQRSQSIALAEEYAKWARVVITFLQRRDEKATTAFKESVGDLVSYFLFQRVGTGIPHQLWRELFVYESHRLVVTQTQYLQGNADAFDILRPRQQPEFIDFDIRSVREGTDYQVEATSELGSATAPMRLPFDPHELETFKANHAASIGNADLKQSPQMVQGLADFGQSLFDALLQRRVRDLYFSCRAHAGGLGSGLRIRLRLDSTPELLPVPWELMFDGTDFLCLSPKTALVRHLDQSGLVKPLTTTLPLRALVTVSSADGGPSLDTATERARMALALAPLTELNLLDLEFADGSLRGLQRALRRAQISGRPYNIWHFIGHGYQEKSLETSVLAFDEDGTTIHVSGFELGTLFRDYGALRLIVLNACEGAVPNKQGVMSGIAAALVERGISTVVAMQFEISDQAAITFSEEFYTAMVDGLPADASVTEARRSVFFTPNYTEWATPVLFMRGRNAQVFDVPRDQDVDS